MKIKEMSKKRLAISLLGTALLMQAGCNDVFATNISGITQNQGTGAYDIRPEAHNGSTGFRKFENFSLDNGDIANFIFQYLTKDGEQGSIDKFVNLVDGKVNINGIVNALDSVGGNLKSDGHLIFVTPNGMVVGGSGVLNVGSLSVFTPTTDTYRHIRDNILTYKPEVSHDGSQISAQTDVSWDDGVAALDRGTGVIDINGKIVARGDITFDGGTLNVGNGARVFAGVNDANNTVFHKIDPQTGETITNNTEAVNNLFDQLVSSKASDGNAFASDNGNIVITTKTGVKVSEGGIIANNNNSEDAAFTITNSGANGIHILGDVSSQNGTLTLDNGNGELRIDSTGTINNIGNLNLVNQENNTGLIIDGAINNKGTLNVTNYSGINGLEIGGTITNEGDATITNYSNDFYIKSKGNITNNAGTNEDGEQYGTLTLHNKSTAGDFNIKGTVTSKGTALNMTNDGAGFIVNGNVTSTNGVAAIRNTNGEFLVDTNGTITSNGTGLSIVNNEDATGINIKGKIVNQNQLVMENTGVDGFNISGSIENTGTTQLKNTSAALGGFTLDSTGRITNNGGALNITNEAKGGMNIKGLIKTNNDGTVAIYNLNSDLKIGDTTSNNYYVDSDGNVYIEVTDGDLLNAAGEKTLIRTTNQGGGNLTINVSNGAIGEEVANGIGADSRDWNKSINVNIDGTISATSTGSRSLVNIASSGKDMKLNQIKADGQVYLLADDMNGGVNTYNILNYNDKNTPNITAAGMSLIASGNIGKEGENIKAVTFVQTDGKFNDTSWTHLMDGREDTYQPDAESTVDMLAQGDIYIKGADGEGSSKVDTNVGSIISKKGSVNAEFSGNTYINEVTAAKDVNLVNRGQKMYIENLGKVAAEDFYGANDTIVPEKANIKVLDLGTAANPNEDSNSTLVIKNGQLNGKGLVRPTDGNTEDLTITADNAYASGYYFHTGGNRGEDGFSTVERNDLTNSMTNTNGNALSIRTKAVRRDDVTAIGRGEDERNYYSGGSMQGDDAGYDKDGVVLKNNQKGYEETDDDNLVVTEPTEPTAPTDPEPTEAPTQAPTEAPTQEPTEAPTQEPTEAPTQEPTEAPTQEPTEAPTQEPTEAPTQEPTEAPTQEPTEAPTQEPTEAPTQEPTEAPTQAPTEAPTQAPTEAPTTFSLDRSVIDNNTWIQRQDISDTVPVVDNSQYIQIDTSKTPTPVQRINNNNAMANNVVEITYISRGGITIAHNNTLKTGDVFPIHIKYGDIDINSTVKVTNASDYIAEAEFTNIAQSTANKLLYLSLIIEGGGEGDRIPASIGNITSLSYNRR